MAKRKQGYEFIRAIRSADGNLRWEWKLDGILSGLAHDEDVTDFSELDVKRLTKGMLDLTDQELALKTQATSRSRAGCRFT